MLINPRVPQPYTRTVSLSAGGKFRIACRETLKGSANTACSSLMSSGMGMHMDSWAGTSGAKPPVAALEFPVWIPGGMTPLVKL